MVEDHKQDKPDFYDDLEKTYEEIWKLLIIGKAKAKSEFHQGYLATYNNEFPSIRTVVLRHVDKEKNSISFHTDFRSKKITELNNNNNVSMMFYDHGKKIQIKVSGKLKLIIKMKSLKMHGRIQDHLVKNAILLSYRLVQILMYLFLICMSMKRVCQILIS